MPLTKEAETYVGRDGIVVALSPEAWDGLLANRPRARFTWAHELGHVRLHGPELFDQGYLEHGAWTAPTRAGGSIEWQANVFAAALLMPRCGLDELASIGHLTADRVSSIFQVSAEAAAIRIAPMLAIPAGAPARE